MIDLNKEKELLDKAQVSDRGFEELYTYFRDDVYRYAYSIVGNRADAEDTTSQTFLEFFKKIHTFV
ncbi:MAG: RNA polymerase sigma factor [Candidatus Dojkabacteria bacterium]